MAKKETAGVVTVLSLLVAAGALGVHWQNLQLSAKRDAREAEEVELRRRESWKVPIDDLEITSAKPLCRGCPSDHASFELVLTNNGAATIELDRVSFSPSKLDEYVEDPPGRVISHQGAPVCVASTKLLVDLDTVTLGVPLSETIGLSIPPGESRTFSVCFEVKNQRDGNLARLLVEGTLIFSGQGKEQTVQMQPFGADEDGVLTLPDYGESSFLN